MWACRPPGFLDDRAASEILAGVHDIVFWGSRDQRDVLLALRDLWNRMSSDVKARIEDRIIKGPPPYPGLSAADNRKHKAWAAHERIEWLRQGGCAISKKLDRWAKRLAPLLPEAAKEGAVHAADSRDSRGGIRHHRQILRRCRCGSYRGPDFVGHRRAGPDVGRAQGV